MHLYQRWYVLSSSLTMFLTLGTGKHGSLHSAVRSRHAKGDFNKGNQSCARAAGNKTESNSSTRSRTLFRCIRLLTKRLYVWLHKTEKEMRVTRWFKKNILYWQSFIHSFICSSLVSSLYWSGSWWIQSLSWKQWAWGGNTP